MVGMGLLARCHKEFHISLLGYDLEIFNEEYHTLEVSICTRMFIH